MPKAVITINDFVGGLNNEASARDIKENELQVCTNLDPSSPGKLTATRSFADYETNGQDPDTGSTASGAVGTGLFVFSNDYEISSSHGANTGDFIIKADSANAELDVIETSDGAINADITGNTISGTDAAAPASPQFYAAEGDLFIGGNHSTAPYALKWHGQGKFTGLTGARTVADWIGSAQARTAPTVSTQACHESSGSDLDSGAIYTDKITWIIKYGADDTGLWENTGDATLNDGTYNEFGASWLYKNNAESSITLVGTNTTNGNMTGSSTHSNADVKVQAWVLGAPTSAGDHIYGAKLYSRKNGESTWYLLAEINYEKGIRGDGEAGWESWIQALAEFDHNAHNASATTTYGYTATTGFINAPPALQTFETFNGFSVADINDTVYWKHGIVANGRAYIGNIKIGNRTHGDRILRSPVFQYDVFSEANYIDVAANDLSLIHISEPTRPY